MEKPLQVFCCYAREDQLSLLTLKKHLRPIQREGLIIVQTDIDVSPGEDWEQKISHYLNTAQIILLLISPDFIDSDYCYSQEMARAMERHAYGEAHVIPIILRPILWDSSPFSKLQALPMNGEPVTSKFWHTPDDAFLDVARGIRDTIKTVIIRLQARKIALFGYETQGGNRSPLWSDPAAFSLDGTYLKWGETKRDFTEREIVDQTWVKAGDHGYSFTIHFLPDGQLRETPLWEPDSHVQGSWELTNGVLRTDIEQYEGDTLVKYELDIFAARNGLIHTGIEFQDGKKTAHAYFVCLPAKFATRYYEALTAFDQLLHVNENCVEAYKTRGDILRHLERYEEALVAYQQAIELRADYMWAWHNLGNVLHELRRFEEALKAYKRTTEIAPSYFWAWQNMGVVLYELGRREEALDAFAQAIKCDGLIAVTWREKGKTLQDLQRYEEALTSYERALELESQYASIWTRKGQVLRMLQRYEEAITAYDKALQLEADYIDAYLGKGRVYLDLKDYNGALYVYEQATNVAPNNTWTWHDKGQTLGHLQRAEEALEAFESAIKHDPENKWAWFHKAEVLTYLSRQAYKKAGRPGREPLKREYYSLVQKATGKCLDGNGSNVYMHDPTGGDFQLWKATEISPDIIVLKHFWSGKVLEATVERGTYFSEYTNSPSQQWRLEDGDDGYKKLKQVITGMVLHGDTNNDVYLQPDNGGGFQTWIAAQIHITSLIATHDSSNIAEPLAFEQ